MIGFGFGFTSDWMKRWREFFKAIVYRSVAKPITFRYLRVEILKLTVIPGLADC